jgi:hypothetical protein
MLAVFNAARMRGVALFHFLAAVAADVPFGRLTAGCATMFLVHGYIIAYEKRRV